MNRCVEDLVKPGQVFKHLTTDSKVPGKHRRWMCLCDCGNKVIAWQTELLRGKKKSCGCKRPVISEVHKSGKSNRKHKFKDLTGLTFNHLTAISFVGLNNIKSSVWKFKCVCGKEIVRNGSQVSRGAIASCGCKKSTTLSEKASLPKGDSIKNSAFKTHTKTAYQRGYATELTLDQYIMIASMPCYYCGSMSARPSNNKKYTIELNSVDRLNNEPYYTLENSVSCCFICQRSKSALSEIGFLDMVKKVYKYRKLGEV